MTSDADLLRVCAWCKRVQINGKWVTPDSSLNATGLTATTHGICEECLQKLKKDDQEK